MTLLMLPKGFFCKISVLTLYKIVLNDNQYGEFTISVLTLDKIKLNGNQYGELLFQFYNNNNNNNNNNSNNNLY